MKGGIYSEDRCPVCGGKFVDNHINGLICPKHPKIRAASFRVKFGKLQKRFRSYQDAQRTLTGWRFKTDELTFDERDYQPDNPLGFSNMSNKWLSYHSGKVKPGTRKNLIAHIRHAQEYFQNRNVKDLRYGDFEDFLQELTELSGKTKHNIMSTIHNFYSWLRKRREIRELPEFPEVKYILGYRRTVSKEVQIQIVEEVRRICPNPKVYLGIKWLTTYISLRPGELIKILEGNIDPANGYLYIIEEDSKTCYKSIPLIKEDVELLESLPPAFPAMRFFRHIKGVSGVHEDEPFGMKYFYKWWKKACENLGVEGVDLYGGTRHSSVRALRKFRSPEEIKRASMSETNKAFGRYMGQDTDADVREVYREAAQVILIEEIEKIGGSK
ncbi:hypothetical protein ER57_08175 [Smithella sp. SCADC]|nr:hypothetical protein ER57_08175 [Smithella sp. SCADC]